MNREELEHIIRASAEITGQYEFVIVGSQSILGPVPNPEDVFTVSMAADIYPKDAPELGDKIDWAKSLRDSGHNIPRVRWSSRRGRSTAGTRRSRPPGSFEIFYGAALRDCQGLITATRAVS